MDAIEAILEKAATLFQTVDGLDAVVLGGSRARGTQRPDSDVDIGLYYGGAAPLNLPALDAAAARLDDRRAGGLIAPPGAWGRWVDGGAWLVVDGRPVDLILRRLNRVREAVRDCQSGRVAPHYQAGHPHAYLNAMYMGEAAVCRVLWDRDGTVSALKAEARVYPPKMRSALLFAFL